MAIKVSAVFFTTAVCKCTRGPLQLGSHDQFFLKKNYIMGYNLKNVRNGKSALKIAKWPSLRPLAVKSKFISQFEFSENLEGLYGKCCWIGLALQQLFPYKSSHSFQSSDCHNISFSNDGGLKLSHLDTFDMLFPFLAFVKL